MNKPEKKEIIPERWQENEEATGWNRACVVWEPYHQEVVNDLVANITELQQQLNSLQIEYVNGEWQCIHVKENVIDGHCPWCQLTVAEKSLKRLQKKLNSLPSEKEITSIINANSYTVGGQGTYREHHCYRIVDIVKAIHKRMRGEK